MDKLKDIQIKLAEVIKQSGYKQTTLASILHVSQPTVSHYVKGDIMPALDTFAKLCEILDVDANYVLGISRSI